MAARDRYQSVISLAERLGMTSTQVEEQDGKLHMHGTVETQYEKDQLWDEIKKVGGEMPNDLMADIKVSNTSYYTMHTVKSGESLSEIAEHYYKDKMKYNQIFESNRGILTDADHIEPGQQLTIPMM